MDSVQRIFRYLPPKYDYFCGVKIAFYFRDNCTGKGKMCPKNGHEPEASKEQAKNYPWRYGRPNQRPTKRVHKKD